MDPQVVWEQLLDAYADHDWDSVDEHGAALRDWVENRLIALATCRLALEHSVTGGAA